MFSQKEGTSPLAEKRVIYSLLKRGTLERRCYSESVRSKKPVFPTLSVTSIRSITSKNHQVR